MEINCAILGDSNVGKTAFVRRLCEHRWTDDATGTTLGVDYFFHNMILNKAKQSVRLRMYDIGGCSTSKNIAHSWIGITPLIFLVFDVTRMESLHHLEQWWQYAKDAQRPDTVYDLFPVFIGTKLDCTETRVVFEEHAREIGSKISQSPLIFFCSAKTGIGVSEAFLEATTAYLGSVSSNIIQAHSVEGDDIRLDLSISSSTTPPSSDVVGNESNNCCTCWK